MFVEKYYVIAVIFRLKISVMHQCMFVAIISVLNVTAL